MPQMWGIRMRMVMGDDDEDDDNDDDDGEYVIAWRHFRLAPWESQPPLRRENTDVSIQSRAL